MADAVLEVGADGSFDAGEALLADVDGSQKEKARQEAEKLRLEGNTAFQRREYAHASELYSQAIAKNPDDHLAFSNRSAARVQLKELAQALEDAERSVALAPTWPKALWRKAAACEALGRQDAATKCYAKILTLVPPDSADGKKAAAKMRNKPASVPDSKPKAVKKGFLSSSSAKKSIYNDKDDDDYTESSATPVDRTWRSMLRRLKEGCNKRGVNDKGERVVLDDGVFAKLLQEREFQQLVYPGIPPEQLVHAPKNLQTLLEDPWYEQELLALMPKVQAKAESVLGNVKKRGAAQGEIMDADTERMLMPQVLQEAFGREVLAMVHRINTKKHALLANDTRMLADPANEMADWDQLDDAFLDALLGTSVDSQDSSVASTGAAFLDDFMGEDWVELLQNDVHRMAKKQLLMPAVSSVDIEALRRADATAVKGTTPSVKKSAHPTGKLLFIESSDCASEYPALAELVEKLHALPYEMNKKRPALARLCAQFAHCTALHQLGPGEFQPLRLDCGFGDKDNGFKLTCIYCFNGDSTQQPPRQNRQNESEPLRAATVTLRFGLDENARVEQIETRSDRLIVFKSQQVLNEITSVRGADDLFYLTFWIHGQGFR